MTPRLAVELGPSGVRVVCLRPQAIADAASDGSYTGELFGRLAAEAGVSIEQMLLQWGENQTLPRAAADAGPSRPCGGLPGIGPRGSDHRSGGRLKLRRRSAGATVWTGTDRCPRLKTLATSVLAGGEEHHRRSLPLFPLCGEMQCPSLLVPRALRASASETLALDEERAGRGRHLARHSGGIQTRNPRVMGAWLDCHSQPRRGRRQPSVRLRAPVFPIAAER